MSEKSKHEIKAKSSIALALLLHLTILAFGQHEKGLVFSPDSDYNNLKSASAPFMGTVPSQVDLSQWFPAPGHQGLQSSCVGWAVAYGLKSYQEAVERNQTPNGTSNTFSPSYVYNRIKMGTCADGSDIEEALRLLKSDGAATLQDFPYDPQSCSQLASQDIINRAKAYAILDFNKVDISDEIELKSQLSKKFPIVIGMVVDNAFENLAPNQIYNGSGGPSTGRHAMIVVGYDDAKSAYKLFNSWGTGWSAGGYGWISYQAFRQYVKRAYTVQDLVNTSPQPMPTTPNVVVPPAVAPLSPSASLANVNILHNQWVSTPNGQQALGMIINVPGQILNAQGSQAQLVIRFMYPNGQPLFANAQEPVFRDSHGLAATGTPKLPVTNNSANTQQQQLTIPYYALNFQSTNGMVTHQIAVQAFLYINDFEKARSDITPMTLTW